MGCPANDLAELEILIFNLESEIEKIDSAIDAEISENLMEWNTSLQNLEILLLKLSSLKPCLDSVMCDLESSKVQVSNSHTSSNMHISDIISILHEIKSFFDSKERLEKLYMIGDYDDARTILENCPLENTTFFKTIPQLRRFVDEFEDLKGKMISR